jgi:hypothetical protein
MSAVDRPKYVLVEYGAVIAAVLAIAGVAALGGAWMASQPSTNTVQEPVFQDDVSTTTDETAVVTDDLPLDEINEGDTLRNQDRYLLGLTPNLTLTVNSSLPEGRMVNITHTLTLRHQATVADGGTLGRNTTVLINESGTTNGTFSTAETINPQSIRTGRRLIGSNFSSAVDVSSELLLDVAYEVDGDVSYSGSMGASAPVVVGEDTYYVDGDLSTSQTEQRMESRTIKSSPNPLSYLGLGVVGVLALAAAAGSVLLRRDIDAEGIRTRIYRNRYNEWISRGEIPTGTDKRYVRINELEDIVDIGIDSNKRVIWNEEYDIYAVVDGDVIYYYTAGSAEIDDWLNV